jgi:regulatory protein
MEDDRLLEKARQKAFRLLALRARSEQELRAKLAEKGFDGETISRVVAGLIELKYLDDESFARGWARNLAVNRLQGNRRIETSLRGKGIPADAAREVIETVREEISEREAIRRILRKRMKGREAAGHYDNKEKRRMAQSLMGRGFPPGLIFEILSVREEE